MPIQPNNLSPLIKLSQQKSNIVLGIISGTSMDGIDLAWVKFNQKGATSSFKVLQLKTLSIAPSLKKDLLQIYSVKPISQEKLCLLNAYWSEFVASTILQKQKQWEIRMQHTDLIASHGQTTYHAPNWFHQHKKYGHATLQIGDGNILATHLQKITVCDFRQKLIGQGFEGAPLALYGDYLLAKSLTKNRVLINLGGIANFTFIPQAASFHQLLATDTGPANGLLDKYCVQNLGKNYDKNGQIAARGVVHTGLLAALKTNPFFKLPLPKTTGPELFEFSFIQRALEDSNSTNLAPAQVLATLTQLSVDTLCEAIFSLNIKKYEVLVSGGGVYNKFLMNQLKLKLGQEIFTTDKIHLPPKSKEAIFIAALGNETLHGKEFGLGKICLP